MISHKSKICNLVARLCTPEPVADGGTAPAARATRHVHLFRSGVLPGWPLASTSWQLDLGGKWSEAVSQTEAIVTKYLCAGVLHVCTHLLLLAVVLQHHRNTENSSYDGQAIPTVSAQCSLPNCE